jgi:hypothetical protein
VRRLALVATVLATSPAASARATTLPSSSVHVAVALKPASVTLAPRSAPRGYTVTFAVKNRTAHRRTFSLAGKRIVVPANTLRLLGFQFDRRGTYRFTSSGAGRIVRGTFRVS